MVFHYLGLYRRQVWSYSELLFHLLIGVFLTMMIFAAGAYGMRVLYHRLFLLYFSGMSVALLFGGRVLWKSLLLMLCRHGLYGCKVAIVGDSRVTQDLVRKISLHPELGYKIVGVLTAGETTSGFLNGSETGHCAARRTEDVLDLLQEQEIEELIFTINPKTRPEFLELIGQCQSQGMSVKFVPDFYEVYSTGMEIQEIEGFPLVKLKKLPLSSWETYAKRLLDVTFATLGLVAAAPLMLGWVIVLRISGRSPVLVKDKRVGRLGRPFHIYRFNVSSTPQGGEDWLSRFCRWLERYSLSELPQLWNVLKGQMSCVGPRPEDPKRVARYSEWNGRRLLVQPGITGLAQINGLRGFSSSDDKSLHDMIYIERQSLLFDLLILLQTPVTILRRTSSRVRVRPAA